jgi:hypothetical protein
MRLSIARLASFGVLAIIMVSILFAISYFITPQHRASAVTPPDSCFAFNVGTGAITNYYNNEGNNIANPACPKDVDIPSTIGGTNVMIIGNSAFNAKGLTSVTIPNGVTQISDWAFYGNQLTSVTLPATLTTIGGSSFRDNLLTSITFPASVTTIYGNSFRGNNITSVTVPGSVSTFGSAVFEDNQITTVVFDGPVASFGSPSFIRNPLDSITYNGTTYLATAPVAEQCYTYSAGTITNYRYSDMNLIKSSGIGCLARDITTPATLGGNPVTTIGNFAFESKGLTSVIISSGVTSVNDYAFNDNSITSISIPDSVTSVGVWAFASNLLTSITITNGVISIGDWAFASNQLSSLIIPNSVTNVGPGAFQNNLLTSIALPNGLTSIGDYVFYNNELSSVTIPNGVTSVGDRAFSSNQLTSITIPNSVTSIGRNAFSYNQLTVVAIPNSVTDIGDYAFYGNQVGSVAISNTVTSIGVNAFSYNKLTSVTIPTSVTSIGLGAFAIQSQWGGDIDTGANGAPDMWSSDPAEVQLAYDGIWYVRLYTSDPSNPNDLIDRILDEDWWMGEDANANGINDSLGGHLINPASLDLQYVNQLDANLRTTQTFTGLLNTAYLNNYFVNQGPAIPTPADSMNPTPLEQQAIDDALSVYYRLGDEVTITPPAINGYNTPPTQTFVLGAATNDFSYVYTLPSSSAGSGGTLANTGMSEWAVIVASAVLLTAGMYPLIRRFA